MERALLQKIIRVNQAGEYGAKRIYEGQKAILKENDLINHMARQEEAHLKEFTNLCVQYKVRPTLLQPFWFVGGYALGYITALLGEKVAHACTIAVETVIEEHYQKQLDTLEKKEDEASQVLCKLIKKCQEEEQEHKQIAQQAGGETIKGFSMVTKVIGKISKIAITLSSRI